jgi:hypothetical protein
MIHIDRGFHQFIVVWAGMRMGGIIQHAAGLAEPDGEAGAVPRAVAIN